MITFPRSVARQIANLFRVALHLTPAQAARQLVHIDADEQRTIVSSHAGPFGLRYRLPGGETREQMRAPLELFKLVGGREVGRGAAPVTLEQHTDELLHACWWDGDVPQQQSFAVPDETLHATWVAPTTWVEQPWPDKLWQALAEAAATTDRRSLRYALRCLQLRGARGEIVATDGRQIFLQSGFTFGWQDDILVPSSQLFGYRQRPDTLTLRVGRTASRVVLEFGRWQFWLTIDQEGRFPRVDDVISQAVHATTRVSLANTDRQFLQDNLPRLPKSGELQQLVTLDLNGSVALRARGADQQPATELVLTNSIRTGEEVRLVMNRHYLERAAKLGFAELCAYGPNAPVLCHDESRKYVWALWNSDDAIKPAANSIQVASTPAAATTPALRKCVGKRQSRLATKRSTRIGQPLQEVAAQPPSVK